MPRLRDEPAPAPDAAGCGCNPALLDLGHDGLGHRISNLLARSGYTAGSEDALSRLADSDLRALGTVGPAAIDRIRSTLAPGGPPPSPGPRPGPPPATHGRPRRRPAATAPPAPVSRAETDRLIARLADWSPWVPHADAVAAAPREPGVYLARQNGEVIYAGMAGPRSRNGQVPAQGLQGRLRHYSGGKALTSGLGEAVFARAISNADWVRERLAAVEAGTPETIRDWGHASFRLAGLELCWAVTPDKTAAAALEKQVIGVLRAQGLLWNQRT